MEHLVFEGGRGGSRGGLWLGKGRSRSSDLCSAPQTQELSVKSTGLGALSKQMSSQAGSRALPVLPDQTGAAPAAKPQGSICILLSVPVSCICPCALAQHGDVFAGFVSQDEFFLSPLGLSGLGILSEHSGSCRIKVFS